ncbi:class I adenylate-forming enzyme family protein [Nocardioides litoris]|uniref:class I adenylate-forming enzyme family protein n=1 Tax=Nocardioides litoris TaxID=1926648 RepID=UPI00111D50E1|nr:class I adenylate-forming enzyme family protein [Nocardioides litoris]
MSTVDELLPRLRATPQVAAFVDPRRRGRAVTRGELADRALAVAGRLHAHGLEEGETVALACRPGPAALAVVLACLRLRLRVALVDPAVPPGLLTARLRAAEARVVVTDPLVRAAAGWAAPVARRAGLRLAPLDDIAPVLVLPRRLDPAPSPDRSGRGPAEALVVFTSGTTGDPRAVVHTTASISAGLDAVTALADVRAGTPVVGGTFFAMAPALLAGAPVATRADRRTVESLRPQLTYLTPPQARALLDDGTRFTGRVFAGSAPVSAHLLGRLTTAGADQAWGVYALTEAFPVAAVESRAKAAYVDGGGTGDLVGTLVPGTTATTDERGQVLVAGAGTAVRHLGGPPLDHVATGDRGEVRGRSVVLHGRLKDMVLRGAENIYPGLHEPSLHVPGVAQALLVGVPGADLDERLVLVVEPEPGVRPRDVRRRLRTPIAALGPAAPDRVVVARIPTRGRSGKPDRAATARMLA